MASSDSDGSSSASGFVMGKLFKVTDRMAESAVPGMLDKALAHIEENMMPNLTALVEKMVPVAIKSGTGVSKNMAVGLIAGGLVVGVGITIYNQWRNSQVRALMAKMEGRVLLTPIDWAILTNHVDLLQARTDATIEAGLPGKECRRLITRLLGVLQDEGNQYAEVRLRLEGLRGRLDEAANA